MSDLSVMIGKVKWLALVFNYNTYYFKFYVGLFFGGNEVWCYTVDRQDTKPDLAKIKKELENKLR